jgi:hypothetical protein
MIFSKTKIKAKSILVRFYFYSDTERGYGDAGTAAYFRIKLDSFVEVEETSISGTKYYTYGLTDEAHDKIQNVLGKSWGYGIGYGKGSQTERKKETERLRKILSRVSKVPTI